jgi:hypothetical protein
MGMAKTRWAAHDSGMGGYLILIAFAVVAVAVVIHVLRTPRMPARRPFESDENSMIGESKSSFSARDPGGVQSGDGTMI